MAKKRKRSTALARSTPRARAMAIGKRGSSAAATAAREESHTIAAVLSSAALGYAQRENMLDTIPHIDALGVEGTLGAAAWAAGRFMKSKVLSHVATGLLSVAAYKLASGTTT